MMNKDNNHNDTQIILMLMRPSHQSQLIDSNGARKSIIVTIPEQIPRRHVCGGRACGARHHVFSRVW